MIEHAVRLAIYSTKIQKENPISMLIVAPVEHGKSEVLKEFAFIDTVKITTDFNSFIFSEFANEFLADRKKTIIIPDFLRVIKKKYSTQANALTIMNAVTEEGWIGSLPLGQKVTNPIKANIITAITQQEMIDKRHKWTQLGFLSRFIPLSYTYKDATKEQIKSYIEDRIYHTDKPYDFVLPKEKQRIELPKEHSTQLRIISNAIAIKNNLTGFRLQRQLQTLAMANALCRNAVIVNQDDINVIEKIAGFINFDFTKI